ncbi:MAG TPA: MarR family transcriptional regulator [Bacillales bacterium]|nr:MarR family transcriptional regulator [Bacillales bacterium]
MGKERERIDEVLRSIRKLNRALFQLLREAADLSDATAVQLMVLKTLSKQPDISLSELADHLQLGNSTMSGVVERLVTSGLIVRERSKEDRRTIVMRLTEAGMAKQEEAFGEDAYLTKRLSKILELPDEQLVLLLDTHQQLITKLEQRDEEDHGA